MSEPEFENVAPDPSAMIESLRAYGYTLATAIADLIDNSIAAHATTIWIRMVWNGSDSWISIADDGAGMSQATLRDAMRLGSQNPTLERDSDDLGRFGLGLKTASLSQCRRLTVRSQSKGHNAWTRRWDLDYLARPETEGWCLLTSAADGSEDRLDFPHEAQHGTVVLWEQLDRLVGDGEQDDQGIRDHWLKLAEDLEQHLALVFHRFLESSPGRIKIFLNGNDIAPWNPFRATESGPHADILGEESRKVPGGVDGLVHFTGFVLPHKDRLGPELHAALSGPKGWNAQQGFYLYRNRRLIVFGSWLGLGGGRGWTQEEHYKLARIQLDIPNSMDHLWQLDVKKSSASPPPQISRWLQGLAQTVRKRAREVFAHRARHGPRPAAKREIARPWKSVTKAGGRAYRIDRKHEFIRAVHELVASEAQDELEAVLRILEETVPVEQIWLDRAEHPEDSITPFAGTAPNELTRIIQAAYGAIRRNKKASHDEAIGLLKAAQEFDSDEALAIIANLVDE